MKKFQSLLPALILLSACAKEPARTGSAPVSVFAPPAIKSLDAGSALRCWRIEKGNHPAQARCLLAWSLGAERSEELEEILAEGATRRRDLAIIAVRHEFPLERIGIPGLASLLKALAADPVWLRGRAINIWLRTHDGANEVNAAELGRLLLGPGPRLPEDYREAYTALRILKPALAAGLLQDHCDPLVTGDLGLRCWRFLSAFAAPGTSALPPELRAWLPAAAGRAWQLFRLTLPLRARLLEPYL